MEVIHEINDTLYHLFKIRHLGVGGQILVGLEVARSRRGSYLFPKESMLWIDLLQEYKFLESNPTTTSMGVNLMMIQNLS